jgi:hypothetical protein
MVAVAATVAVLPAAVSADQPVGSTANASTTALSLSINPSALLSVSSASVQQLPANLRTLLTTTLQPTTLRIDGANASASRSAAVADLASGHSDATPVALDASSLSQLLSNLHAVLADLGGRVSVPALQSTLADVATVTGNSTVMALLPAPLAAQLTTLNQQLGSLSTKLAALAGDTSIAVDQLQATLGQQLGAQLRYVTGVKADIDAAHPQGQSQSSAALTVPPQVSLPPLVSNLPLIAQLAPFGATAVNSAGAAQFGAGGPQTSSNESTTSIDVAPAMDLTDLRADAVAVGALLSQVSALATAVAPQLGAVSAIVGQALPGGLSLSALIAQVATAAGPAGQLSTLVAALQLNKMLSCRTLSSGTCVIASTSITPQGAGLHAVATSKLVDLAVLPMGSTLAAALSSLGGATADTPLLDVQGVQATSDAFIDGSISAARASGQASRVAVAGLVVMDNGQLNKQGLVGHVVQQVLDALPGSPVVGEPMVLPIQIGSGVLTLQITLGAEQRTYTGASHRSASIGKLQVRLLNGDTNGQNPVSQLGASQAGPIVTLDTAMVSSEVLGTGTDGTLVPLGEGSQVTMGQTGLFGPASLVVGFGLLGAGVVLRRLSRRGVAGGRRRTS